MGLVDTRDGDKAKSAYETVKRTSNVDRSIFGYPGIEAMY